MRRSAPPPGASPISTEPPDCLAKPNTIDRPSPVPSPTGLVEKKGSNTRSRMPTGMPGPLSRTHIPT